MTKKTKKPKNIDLYLLTILTFLIGSTIYLLTSLKVILIPAFIIYFLIYRVMARRRKKIEVKT